jgi:hypothetical protein
LEGKYDEDYEHSPANGFDKSHFFDRFINMTYADDKIKVLVGSIRNEVKTCLMAEIKMTLHPP